jgi:hypothetical protein
LRPRPDPVAVFYRAVKKATAVFSSGLTEIHDLRRIFKILPEFSGRHTGGLRAGGMEIVLVKWVGNLGSVGPD